MSSPEAFLLLSLVNTTLTTPGLTQSGTLHLECVTVPIPEAATNTDRDVYLILRLNTIETPIDPARVIHRADGPGYRSYTFRGTEADPTQLLVTISLPSHIESMVEDLETFESILAQYADLQVSGQTASISTPIQARPRGYDDLRGHLVVINEESGEVVGQFDDKLRVKEDPKLGEKGHENDAVIIEVPEESGQAQDSHAMEMFVRAVPPEQQDWITQSATIVSHAISKTTNLLLTTITTASNYYISNSAPSPHHPNTASSPGVSPTPPPLPPRALVFLTSERTRKGLGSVHAVSGHAVKISSKTVLLIDNIIRHALGSKQKRVKTPLAGAFSPSGLSSGLSSTVPTRSASPFANNLYLSPGSPNLHTASKKPSLPPRSPSPAAPPLPSRSPTKTPEPTTSGVPPPQLSTKARVILSANLILSTLDHSTRQLLNVGTESIGAVVDHKYGPHAAETSLLMAGTARNVGLIYVDMRGIGRRALLKQAGKQFVKTHLSSNRDSN